MVPWEYYDKKEHEEINDKYLPDIGEGETMATQVVTAVNKLVYRFYNDGDVYDNTYHLNGWANDLSSYANWLYQNTDVECLLDIRTCYCDEDYEDLLREMADHLLDMDKLDKLNDVPAKGSIYECDGPFEFVEEEYEEDYEEEMW